MDGRRLRLALHGSLFFGAVTQIDRAVQAVEAGPQQVEVVLDATHLAYLDATGVDALRQLHQATLLRGGSMAIENLQPQPLETTQRTGLASELAAQRVSQDISL